MQVLFLDVTAEQLAHNQTLQSLIDLSDVDMTTTQRYIRICLQDASLQALQETLACITIEESVYWVLRSEHHQVFYTFDDVQKKSLREQIQARLLKLVPQMKLFIYHDMERCMGWKNPAAIPSWNVEGYLQFSAGKLKWTVQTVLQEAYQAYQDEADRASFIALLQFCIATQPCILEDVYLTLHSDFFSIVDLWGNDLQQIYLDALPKEEYDDVQMHDLLLSILMTLLPKNIHLFVESEQMQPEQLHAQQKLVQLLQEIFVERLIVESGR